MAHTIKENVLLRLAPWNPYRAKFLFPIKSIVISLKTKLGLTVIRFTKYLGRKLLASSIPFNSSSNRCLTEYTFSPILHF